MEDDKIKELFSGFEPQLSSDSRFMRKLQQNMEAVELVKRRSESVRKRNRVAVVVAALSGFVAGVILSLLYPLISESLPVIQFKMPYVNSAAISVSPQVPIWICMAIASGIIAYNAYVITLSRLSLKEGA